MRWRIGDIPLKRLFGPGVVIDITRKTATDKDAQLTVGDIDDWENLHGRIPDGAIILMNSGMAKHYANPKMYFGYPNGIGLNDKNTKDLHFPGVRPDAAKWLVDERLLYTHQLPITFHICQNTNENLAFYSMCLKNKFLNCRHRNIIGLGVDTPSTDFGQSKDFKTHQILGASDVWGLENVANVDALPPKGFTVYNMVYKLKEGSGGPSRKAF